MLSPLRAVTPAAWVAEAVRRWPELLADHGNCEKKAASTALALMFAYPEDRALATRLSKLAREELRHFEQVDKLMQEQGVE
ncbi:MAG: tRNA-(ms[2]io[6]A)-hydroxylase, partial [Gammaproteobacteria bacterium]|nr:tRNA-(ms[2]io[6]A)-hydroxylase [Gammaproteobacteria bacterium]